MKRGIVLLILLVFLLSACQPDVCPPESVEYIEDPSTFPPLDSVANESFSASKPLEIGGKLVEVDRVIHGPLCNDTWRGTIYVACDVQVAAWTEEQGPFFLDECDLTIEPGTVVYVAAHNDTAYYQGCSVCHASETTPSR
jgi:hypothetical protein